MPTPYSMFPNVTQYENGQLLDANTMNIPIAQLTQRTAWLYKRLGYLAGTQNFGSVRYNHVEVEDDVVAGDCVYLDPDTGLFTKALAKTIVESNPFNITSKSSLAVGIMVNVGQGTPKFGTIVMSGILDFSDISDVFDIKSMVESGELSDGEEFKSGPYYLSSKDPGKITSSPVGPAIYIGTFISKGSRSQHGTYALLAPQYKDVAEMHHHRAFALPTSYQGGLDNDAIIGFSPKAIPQDGGQSIVPTDIHLFIQGSYINTKAASYWLQVQHKQPGTSGSYNSEFGEVSGWGDPSVFIQWNELYGSGEFNSGYSSLSAVSGSGQLEYTFSLGSNGLVGRLVLDRRDVTVKDYRFGGPDYGYSTPVVPLFSTADGIGWQPANPDQIDEDGTVYDYEYDVGLCPDLNKFFPPIPLGGCALLCNGVELPSYELYGNAAAYRVTNTKILWSKANAGGLLPFSTPGSEFPVKLTFYTTRGKLASSSFVTSLKAAQGSGIKIREEGTPESASTGNLVVDANIPIETSDPGLAGYRVPKQVVNNKLVFGPVVSSVKAGPGLVVSSAANQPAGCGDVLISFDDNYSGAGMFDDIVLHNAKQELIGPFPYIKLLSPSSVASGFTMKMHVPISLPDLAAGYKLIFCMSAFGLDDIGTSGEPLAARINITAHVLQDWYPGISNTSYLSTFRSAGLNTIGADDDVYIIPFGADGSTTYSDGTEAVYKAFDPIFVYNDGFAPLGDDKPLAHYKLKIVSRNDNAPFEITGLHPNSSVAITVKRSASSAGSLENYSGEIGFINMSWRLVPDSIAVPG